MSTQVLVTLWGPNRRRRSNKGHLLVSCCYHHGTHLDSLPLSLPLSPTNTDTQFLQFPLPWAKKKKYPLFFESNSTGNPQLVRAPLSLPPLVNFRYSYCRAAPFFFSMSDWFSIIIIIIGKQTTMMVPSSFRGVEESAQDYVSTKMVDFEMR